MSAGLVDAFLQGLGTSGGLRARQSSSSIDGQRAGRSSSGRPRGSSSSDPKVDVIFAGNATDRCRSTRTRRERFPSSRAQVAIGETEARREPRARSGTSRSCPTGSAWSLSGKGWICSKRGCRPRSACGGPARTRRSGTRWRKRTRAPTARAVGVHLQLLEARGANEFENAFAAMSERAGALVAWLDPLFGVNRARLLELAAKRRLPAMCGSRGYVGGWRPHDRTAPIFDRSFPIAAATYVDKHPERHEAGRSARRASRRSSSWRSISRLRSCSVMTVRRPVLLRADPCR